ncbi:MAG: AAA family ATPase [Sandaracinaceae bacterium]|nr:AAA family ATPase [Sandaracinaceae bacterium]
MSTRDDSPPAPVAVARVRRHADPDALGFETTAEIEPLVGLLGQARAEQALRFGLAIKSTGFNLYVLGPPGLGRHRLTERTIEDQAAGEPASSDWVYVHCFRDADKPRALALPAGRGAALQEAMRHLIEELQLAIPTAFESDEYRNRRRVIEQKVETRHEEAFAKLSEAAEQKSLRLLRTPMGFAFAPTMFGEVLTPDQFGRLPEDKQKELKAALEAMEEELRALMHQLPKWQREARQELRELNQEVAGYAAAHQMREVMEAFQDLEPVRVWLEEVRQDVIEHAHELRETENDSPEAMVQKALKQAPGPLAQYRVNLLVDRRDQPHAPVVFEDQPTLDNLVGRIESRSQLGVLISDFTLIKSGALHRANGGYLILDALRLLTSPSAWDSLKRALRAKDVRIHSVAQALGLVSTKSLEPEPVPLDVKVVLIGERRLYYLLSALDPEFDQLFKVAADFEDEVPWDADHTIGLAKFMAGVVKTESLLPLHKSAVACALESASRWAGDQSKLSTEISRLADLVREADYLARRAGRAHILADDVQAAIDERERREGRIRERSLERFTDGTILLHTRGAVVGQINGLSVLGLGRTSFGRPTRITCRVRLGKGEVIDIEREVQLGGPIHSKGVMILSGYLGARYALERPLSLSASLVFEQSYGGVEGDSASLAELCALLSALAEAPIEQRFAVTGSVNQMGQVQPIGGVNEKIEGFFDVCRESGLDGSHGVLIPPSNVKHLMLRPDVVEAIAQSKFAIYEVPDVDRAMLLLTGLAAGEAGPDGSYPEGTLHQRVQARLTLLAERAKAFASRGREDEP